MACLDKTIRRNRDDYNGGEQQSDFISSVLVPETIKENISTGFQSDVLLDFHRSSLEVK